MSSIPHDNVDRIENILQSHRNWEEFHAWMLNLYRRMQEWDTKDRRDPVVTRTIRFFKHVLGRQDICVVFRHRNWVWHRPNEGWTLYVDRRGPVLHVRLGMTQDEAWEAFEKFRGHVEAVLG